MFLPMGLGLFPPQLFLSPLFPQGPCGTVFTLCHSHLGSPLHPSLICNCLSLPIIETPAMLLKLIGKPNHFLKKQLTVLSNFAKVEVKNSKEQWLFSLHAAP